MTEVPTLALAPAPDAPFERGWRRLDVASVVALLGVLLFVQRVLLALLGDVREYDGPIGVVLALFPTIVSGAAVLMLARRRHLGWYEIGFDRPRSWLPSFVAWVGCVAAGPAFAGVVALFGVQAWRPFQTLQIHSADATGRPLDEVLWYALGVVVVAPVVEELVFRGMLFRAVRQRWALAPALVVSGLVFSGAHFNAINLVPLLFVGMLLGWAYARTGSIWGSIVPHAGLNLLTLVALLARQP